MKIGVFDIADAEDVTHADDRYVVDATGRLQLVPVELST
jgi:hypothetical protein